MVDRGQEGKQPGGQGLTRLLIVYLFMSALLMWLTFGRFAVDEARIRYLEDACSPR